LPLERRLTVRDTVVHHCNPLLKRRLPRITASTLLCWGEQDRVAPLVRALTWAKAIPGAQLVAFPAAGHVPRFAREVMPHFREDGQVDETAGVGR
jgi:pimeloyl-ACP methyl ester carboxylesterase